MATILALVTVMHGVALLAVLLLARYSAVLVDEEGRPIQAWAWHERVVPPTEEPAPRPQVET